MSNPITVIARYTVLEAIRNRLIWMLLVVLFVAIGFSGFMNDLALTEKREVQVAVLAALCRLAAIFILATFVVSSMVRESNDKGVELLLALPMQRASYLFGKFVGFAVLAAFVACLFGLAISLAADIHQVLLWMLSLMLESLMVIGFSLLCVFTFNQIMPALCIVLGFYCVSRSITALVLMSQQPMQNDSVSQTLVHWMVNALSLMLPHLDQYTQTDWLVYNVGTWQALLPLLAQTLIYVALLTSAAAFDLYRKNI